MPDSTRLTNSIAVDHSPVARAFVYLFDYRGRSVVISGDTVVTPDLIELSRGADLAVQDALSLPIIQALARAAAGTRPDRILRDIQDYHAATGTLDRMVFELSAGSADIVWYR